MADITWTTALPVPSGMTFGLHSNTFAFDSPLSGTVQTVSLPGARWIATLQWATLTIEQAALLQVMLVQLRGRANRLVLWNLARQTPRGVGGGTPLVNGAAQTGASINIDGLPISTNNIYLPGDFLGISGELKMVTAPTNSNGSGQATVTFEPPLRASPADNSAIVTAQPTAKFVLASNDVAWQHVAGQARFVSAFESQLAEVFS
jgi:hypothetical protein